jgi:hypothetical protein
MQFASNLVEFIKIEGDFEKELKQFEGEFDIDEKF